MVTHLLCGEKCPVGLFTSVINVLFGVMVAVSVVMPQTAEASSTLKTEPQHSVAELQALAVKIAEKKGVSAELLSTIVKRESGWNVRAVGDMSIPCPGGVAGSYGLAQIHLCAHKSISMAEALDPAFALTWSAEQLAEGKCRIWTTCPL